MHPNQKAVYWVRVPVIPPFLFQGGDLMKVHEIITERIIEKLKQGVVPWSKPWKDGEIPRNIISKQPYKGINIVLLGMSPYLSSWWLTSKQARCLGGRILQKEWYRYTPVVYWNWLDVEDDDGEEKTIPFMRFYKLYNLNNDEIAIVEGKGFITKTGQDCESADATP